VPVGTFNRAEIARPAVVVEDDLLIQIPKVGHWQASQSRADGNNDPR
jgi:hypothetical protein